MKLKELGLAALKAVSEELTFSINDVETKASKTGNVGYKVVTDQGKVITFWDTTMDDVIEEVNAVKGLYAVKPGVTRLDDGGLIAAGKTSGGFWS